MNNRFTFKFNLLIALGITLFWTTPLFSAAVATKVMVRAVSRDAKIIGTAVGAAKITIRDLSTGTVLAQGIQEGGTGDTQRIMLEPRKRGQTVYDTEGAAGFVATLMLGQPTVVEITAEGPLGTPQSTQRASKTLLLIPGEHILGEGVLLEIHGFTVALVEPTAETRIVSGRPLEVRATVRMT